MRNILFLVKKELKSYFDSPVAYIVIVVFLLLWEFLFFRGAFLVGEASLRALFNLLPWLFLLLIPAITMGSISQEKSDGTLEFLLTHPLKDRDLILGKFFAALVFSFMILLFVLPVAVSFSFFGNLDWGVLIGQCFAGILLAAFFIALGILVSSFFKSQISSLLVIIAVSFLLIIAGFDIVTMSLPLSLSPVFEQVSVLSHFNAMSRGIIDIRDFWYFLSAIFIFLSLAYLQLVKRRLGNFKSLYLKYKVAVFLFIGIAVITNIAVSRISGRIDLTEGKVYTLSDATKKTLSNLNNVVTITLYASSKLPAQLQPVLRETKDMLMDYQNLGKGKVAVSVKDPSGNPKVAQEASSLGLKEVRFNVIGQEELQVKQGYLGLVVSYGKHNEAIPYIQDTGDLEYQLTSLIRKLTITKKKKVAFLSGHGEKTIYSDYKIFSQELKKEFEVSEIDLSGESGNSIPEDVSVLVVAGPNGEIGKKERASIKNYLESGGAGLFLIDTVNVSPQVLLVSPNKNSFADFLKDYGIEVQTDVVYDLRSNETVSFREGGVNFLVKYPFWVRVVADEDNSIASHLGGITLPWGSSISLKGKTKSDVAPLLTTTRFGGHQVKDFSISPQTRFSKEDFLKQTVAVSLVDKDKKTRMIVVGDSDFLSDAFLQNNSSNLVFGLGAVSWLSQEESLAEIQLKRRVDRKLFFENPTQIELVKFGNMAFAVLLPLVFGLFRFIRRRNLRKLNYSERK